MIKSIIVKYITQRLQKEVLNTVFASSEYGSDEGINAVLKDFYSELSIVKGLEVVIPISKCSITTREDNYLITVPKSLIGNKPLMSVTELISMDMESFNKYKGATTQPTSISISDMRVVSNYVIRVNNSYYPSALDRINLKVHVEYQDSLSELGRRGALQLAQFALTYVKMHAYKELSIKLKQGELYYGQTISALADEVSKYETAEEEHFNNLLGPIPRLLIMMNSDSAYNDIIGNVTNY